MKTENIFEIKNLVCSYSGKHIVLKVEELNIPKGKIVVLLGPSGAGKSTILETLGLMNKTIVKGSEIIFKPNNKDTIDLAGSILKNDAEELADIRKKHFSFIFQSTNLMPNFTAYENISLTQMIEGVSKKDAILKSRDVAEKLGLDIDENKKVFEMSGGERQRTAFVRAIMPKFSVLFGDEPTGNLDPKSAKSLLSILRKTIRENKRSAVIVSHDVNLAVEFADIIIVMKKELGNGAKGYSKITNETTFYSNEKQEIKTWIDYQGVDISSDIKILIQKIILNEKS